MGSELGQQYPAEGPLVIGQGVTFRRRIRLHVADQPVILTGGTVRWHVRRTRKTATAYLELESDTPSGQTGIHITQWGDEPAATYSEFVVYISDEVTGALAFSAAVFQCEVEFANGEKRRYLYNDKVTLDLDAVR